MAAGGAPKAARRGGMYELVVVGTSLGGLRALERLLGGLPKNFPMALAIVQHRRADAGQGLAALLGAACALPVDEPDDKAPISAGRVYLAPAGYHLLVDGDAFSLSTEAPVLAARPSIDVLFDSAAYSRGPRVIAVVLTGASADGARGAAAVRSAGGRVLVQDPATAESPPMPAAARPFAHEVLPLEGLAPRLLALAWEPR